MNIGLELNPKKTTVTHTLRKHEGNVGFDFLGQHVRQYPVGKTHSGKNGRGQPLGFKTIIKPSKEAIKRHTKELASVVEKYSTASQEVLIGKLNPMVTGWANYHRAIVAKAAFSYCDDRLYSKLRRWAQHRHPRKTARWAAKKYWAVDKGEGWTFKAQDGSTLKYHAATPIQRHVKVCKEASPYDGNLIYWANRLQNHPMLRTRAGSLLKVQGGRCAYCGLLLRDGDVWEIDHIIPVSLGGDDTMKNLQIMHRHCHDQKTAKDGTLYHKPGVNDKDHLTEEPCAGKLARTVLKGGG